MGRPWGQDFLCEKCDDRWDAVIDYDDRKKPIPCRWEDCDGTAVPVIGAPMPMKAAFHDGVKRKGFAELKESYKLESEAYNAPADQRAGIEREVRKLREVKK